jgi:hypothetical protein
MCVISAVAYIQMANENTPRTLIEVMMLAMADAYWMPVLSPLVTIASVRTVRRELFPHRVL